MHVFIQTDVTLGAILKESGVDLLNHQLFPWSLV